MYVAFGLLLNVQTCKMTEHKRKTEKYKRRMNQLCCILSAPGFIADITTDWKLYLTDPPIPDEMKNMWLALCIIGTVLDLLFIIIDCCFCYNKGECKQDERTFTTQFVFLATVIDILLLIMSLHVLHRMLRGMCGVDIDSAREPDVDALLAFLSSGITTCYVSIVRLAKVWIMGCQCRAVLCECEDICDLVSRSLLTILYIIAVILSFVVITYAAILCTLVGISNPTRDEL